MRTLEGNGGPLARSRSDSELPFTHPRDLARQPQAKPGARHMQTRLSLDATELREQLRPVLLGDADSLIDHDDPSSSAVAIDHDRYRLVRGGGLDRVAGPGSPPELEVLGVQVRLVWRARLFWLQRSAGMDR